MMRVIGCSGLTLAIGLVTRSWWRVATIGTRRWTELATRRSQAPAASTTTGVRIVPREVRTPWTAPPATVISSTRVSGRSAQPSRAAARA